MEALRERWCVSETLKGIPYSLNPFKPNRSHILNDELIGINKTKQNKRISLA